MPQSALVDLEVCDKSGNVCILQIIGLLHDTKNKAKKDKNSILKNLTKKYLNIHYFKVTINQIRKFDIAHVTLYTDGQMFYLSTRCSLDHAEDHDQQVLQKLLYKHM